MRDAMPPDPSPYRPPALLADSESDELDKLAAAPPPVPLPLWVSAAFAATAIAIHLGMALSGLAGRGTTLFVSQVGLPVVLLALFTLACLSWYTSQSLAGSRSLRGNLLLALWVPAVALLNFVPAFLAITVMVVAVGHSAYLMLIPLAIAYLVAAVGVSRWLWWWFAGRR